MDAIAHVSTAVLSTRATLIGGSTYNESWAYDTLGRMYRATENRLKTAPPA